VAVEILVDQRFTFKDGWSPQSERLSIFRARVNARFKTELTDFETRVRMLIESKGGLPTRRRYSVDNFKWFAQYQLRGMSSVQIENARGSAKGDESTVLKGIKTAAQLVGWNHLRSDPPLK
jgi:hypothetical protein